VIARIDGDLGALQVDRIGERMEIMLKPLDGLLSGLPGITGSTLLGDGSVLLVLDLAELLQ
jgi:two-component system, chemotaxis family, sensor kinase CheA